MAAVAAGSGRISLSGGPVRLRRYDEERRVTEGPLVASASNLPSWNGDWRRPKVSGHRSLWASMLQSKCCGENHGNGLIRCE
jgi:hypothetical protein